MAEKESYILIPDTKPLYLDLYNLGCAYANSAELVDDYSNKSKKILYKFPVVVSRSFALELLLKFFIVLDIPGIKNKSDFKAHGVSFRKYSHKLVEIWRDIKPEYKEQIVKNYECPKNHVQTVADFESKLINIDESPFVKWRYVHEEVGINHLQYDNIKLLLDAVGKTADALVREAILKQ